MKAKLLRFVMAGAAVITGFILAVTLARPPHLVKVAVLKAAVSAGTPLTSADLTSESVMNSWAKSAGLLSPTQAIGFRSAVALPIGVPIPASDRWSDSLGSGEVALPVTIPEGNAPNVQAGSIVAIYKITSGGNGAGDLIGTGVHVVSVQAPSGAPNPQTDEVVILRMPSQYAPSIVGNTVVLALMSGNPATQWMSGALTSGSSSTPKTK
ncbi:MAG: SAF domain-containing protein, partial [Thermaerobacter sp.]|nr:SAF domain-containing protein [Thermaerobacter sp.]